MRIFTQNHILGFGLLSKNHVSENKVGYCFSTILFKADVVNSLLAKILLLGPTLFFTICLPVRVRIAQKGTHQGQVRMAEQNFVDISMYVKAECKKMGLGQLFNDCFVKVNGSAEKARIFSAQASENEASFQKIRSSVTLGIYFFKLCFCIKNADFIFKQALRNFIFKLAKFVA